jgi:hypothetical protein
MSWRVAAALSVILTVPALAGTAPGAQEVGGPLTYDRVAGVPFTADAATTARLTFADGTQINQTTTARYYRNSAGDARVELRFENARPPQTAPERHIRTVIQTIDEHGKPVGLTLDPVTRAVRGTFSNWVAYAAGGASPEHAALDSTMGERKGGLTFAVPLAPVPGTPVRLLMLRRAQDLLIDTSRGAPFGTNVRDEALGTRTIAGIDTVGRRVTLTVPTGALGNDAAYDLVDERWESPELRLLVSSQLTDTRTGTVNYQLTNIVRSEPAASLFAIPSDYTWEHGAPYVDTRNLKEPEGAWLALVYPDPLPKLAQTLGAPTGQTSLASAR